MFYGLLFNGFRFYRLLISCCYFLFSLVHLFVSSWPGLGFQGVFHSIRRVSGSGIIVIFRKSKALTGA